MSSTAQPLLAPLTLGGLRLPNRVVMAPMTRARADNPELAPNPLHATYYGQRASAGLVITEGTWVNEQAIGFIHVPGIYTPAQVAGWNPVTDAVHTSGGRIICQLGHTGALAQPNPTTGTHPVGPSAINIQEKSYAVSGMKDTVTPRALTKAEIEQTIADYAAAARNARQAGFDGVEIHAQGSHLIAQFLNPAVIHRDDGYGGSLTNRARLLLSIVKEVTAVWDTPRVGVKISPYWSSGPAFQPTAHTLADYDQIIRQLSAAGLAYLHLMGPRPGLSPELVGPNPLSPFARYRPAFAGPIVANVGFTQHLGNAIIEQGAADAASFAAPYIANPDLVARFTDGHPLAQPNPATFYTGGAAGYTDYPPAEPSH
jgi:N-ethylmaleimide reductase